jgi:hypothetical protein
MEVCKDALLAENFGYNADENHSHFVDTHHNQDKVFKESFDLLKGLTIDFLDLELKGEVTEILSTEVTETTTKKAYGDNALKLSTNRGVSTEWEVDLTEEDMLRFASYHIDFTRKHKIPFTTVIITTKPPRVTGYESPSMSFKPKIINLKERDADKTLVEIEHKLKTGENINELQLIYLPLYGSKSGKTTADLLDTALKLTLDVAKDDKTKRDKLQSLMILLNSTFVSEEELNRVLEANKMVLEENRGVKVLANIYRKEGFEQGITQGIAQGLAQTAINMLRKGRNIQEVAEDTGLSIAKVTTIQEELFAQ